MFMISLGQPFNDEDNPINYLQDETARIVMYMYENQSWLPVASLFGLVGVSRPLQPQSQGPIDFGCFCPPTRDCQKHVDNTGGITGKLGEV